MINEMPIFYSFKIGRGLKVVSTTKGLEPVQSKKGKGACNKKNAIKSHLLGKV